MIPTPSPFDWSRLISAVRDESFGIPADVTFQMEEKTGNKKKLCEVRAHKMILGLVSPTFKAMFYATDVQDKTANDVENKTANDVEDKTANDVEDKTANDVEDKTANDVEHKTANDVEHKTANDVEHKTANDVEDKTTNVVEDKTANDVEDKTTNVVEDKTANVVEDKTANDVEDKTANSIEDKTAKDVEDKTTTDVEDKTANAAEDKTANVVRIDKTTAFKIMMDAVYNIRSITTSVKGKSVHEVFDVVILVERYQIVELMEAVKEHLSNYPIINNHNNVLEVAAEAKEYTNMFEAEAHELLCTCAKFLKSKLKDVNAVARYAAEHEDRGEVLATLLARMNDVAPSTPTKCANKAPKPFDWSSLITAMSDDSFGIPSDVSFQIEGNGQLHEVKAHKMILGMVSPIFKTMFYATDVEDKTANVIRIEMTTALAFQIMIDAVYNTRSIKSSLEGKSIHKVFDVLSLVERYQIVELMDVVKEHLSRYPITDNNLLEVAAEAKEYTNMFEAEAHQLLCTCAKFLKSKLKDLNAVVRYAAEHEDRGEVLASLLARMNDIAIDCGNSNEKQKTDCVNLDTSVSSVEVSADEKEEKGATRCDWCKRKFNENNWGKLNRHKKLSHETPCPNCDLMFVDEIDLATHSYEYHGIGKRHNYA